MLGPSKDHYRDLLVGAWNHISELSNRAVQFKRYQNGWDWAVFMSVVAHDQAEQLIIYLFKSESAALFFLRHAPADPWGQIGARVINGATTPFVLVGENIGLRDEKSLIAEYHSRPKAILVQP